MNIVERLKAWITLIEAVLIKPQDTTQLDAWIHEAEDLSEGLGFEEEDGQLVDEVLDGYERLFQDQFRSVATNLLSTVHADTLIRLKSRHQTEQRSAAWYAQAATILTASELGTLFGSPKARSALILSKVNPVRRPLQPVAVTSPSMSAFDWGIRFEPVVKQIYNHKYSTTIHELGRLISEVDSRCSASPDGLVESDPLHIRTGRLIEIKCPVTRIPDGKVPKDYYNQIQLQLQVTGLHACDFVEAVFTSPYSSPLKREPRIDPEFRGEVVLLEDSTGTQRYEYSPVNCEPDWLTTSDLIVERVPWTLHAWHEQVVVASTTWWPSIQPAVDAFWQDVEKAKTDPEFLNSLVPKKVDSEACLIRIPN
jgi:hypothetical protein